jgi:hypothetical protein
MCRAPPCSIVVLPYGPPLRREPPVAERSTAVIYPTWCWFGYPANSATRLLRMSDDLAAPCRKTSAIRRITGNGGSLWQMCGIDLSLSLVGSMMMAPCGMGCRSSVELIVAGRCGIGLSRLLVGSITMAQSGMGCRSLAERIAVARCGIGLSRLLVGSTQPTGPSKAERPCC